jgi:hypothetical protein
MLIIVDRSYLFICVIILANAFAMLFHVSKGRTCMFFFVVVEEIAYVYAGSPPPLLGKKYLCSVRALVSSDSHRDTTRKYYKSFPASSTLLGFFIEYVPVGISAASSDILAVARTQRSTSCGLWRRPSPRARPGNAVSSPRAQANRIRVTVIGIQSFAHSFLN